MRLLYLFKGRIAQCGKRAKRLQKRFFPLRAHANHIVKNARSHAFSAKFAMEGNSKAVSLVANLLNQIKTGAPSRQNNRTTFLPRYKELFVSLRKTAYGNIARPKLIKLLDSS